MSDARFEDGGDQPLRLLAMDDDDLRVIATLVQDAVLPASEIKWVRGQRRLALLLNRFRWEHRVAAAPAERVQSLLVIEDVTGVASQGLEPTERDVVLSLLDLRFEAGEDGRARFCSPLPGMVRCGPRWNVSISSCAT